MTPAMANYLAMREEQLVRLMMLLNIDRDRLLEVWANTNKGIPGYVGYETLKRFAASGDLHIEDDRFVIRIHSHRDNRSIVELLDAFKTGMEIHAT